jgi:glycosyltransferase involved in cell wall biosynthesis
MSAALVARGHEVHVLTGPHDQVMREGPRLRPGVTFHTVDFDSGDAALDAYPTFPLRYSMAVLDGLKRLTAARPFDYVEFPDYHGEGYFALRAKRTLGMFAGTTLAVRLHSTSWICRDADRIDSLDLEYARIEHIERAAVAEADVVLAPAESVLEKIALSPTPFASLAHVPEHVVLPTPIEHGELFRELGGHGSAGERAESNGTLPASPTAPVADGPTVLFFGKLQYLKGPHDFVGAALHLLDCTNARFHLIGNDSDTGPFGGRCWIICYPASPRRSGIASRSSGRGRGGGLRTPSAERSHPAACACSPRTGSHSRWCAWRR